MVLRGFGCFYSWFVGVLFVFEGLGFYVAHTGLKPQVAGITDTRQRQRS